MDRVRVRLYNEATEALGHSYFFRPLKFQQFQLYFNQHIIGDIVHTAAEQIACQSQHMLGPLDAIKINKAGNKVFGHRLIQTQKCGARVFEFIEKKRMMQCPQRTHLERRGTFKKKKKTWDGTNLLSATLKVGHSHSSPHFSWQQHKASCWCERHHLMHVTVLRRAVMDRSVYLNSSRSKFFQQGNVQFW